MTKWAALVSGNCSQLDKEDGQAFPRINTIPTACPMKTHAMTRPIIFRFKPNWGSGVQMLQRVDNAPGDAYHIVDGSTICIDNGYHPCVALPDMEMYYFTILGGLTQRSLIQYFQPTHAYQVETIPGIKDMIAKFK